MLSILRRASRTRALCLFAASISCAPWAAAQTTPSQTAPSPNTPATPEPSKAAPSTSRPSTAGLSTVENARSTPDVSNAALLDPKTITLRTLPNGVRSLVKETRGTGVVAVQVWVRAGSRYETQGNNGVSRLIEEIALNNSTGYPRSGRADEATGGAEGALEGIGAVVTSQTTRDATNYGATVASGFLVNAVRALADAVTRPRLSDAEVDTTKLELQDDAQRREADPLQAVADLAFRVGFARHPYRFSPGGNEESLEKLRGTAVREFFAHRYVGSNISVVIVGDVDAASAHQLVANSFAAVRAGKTDDVLTTEGALKAQNIVRRRQIARTALVLAFRAPGLDSPEDVVAMDVLLSYWNEGRDAALRRVLLGNASVDETSGADAPDDTDPHSGSSAPDGPEPLALGFDVNFLTQRDPGLLFFTLITEPELRATATKATLDEVARVRRDGLTGAEMTRAKRELKRQYIAQGETPSGQAGALGFYEMIGTYKFATEYLDRIDRVSAADIRRLTTKYFAPANVVQATIEAAPPTRPSRPLGGSDTVPV